MLSRFGIRTGTLHPERKNGYSAVDFTGPWSQYLPSPESAEKGAAPHPPLVRTVRTVRTPGNIDDSSNPNRAYEDPVRTVREAEKVALPLGTHGSHGSEGGEGENGALATCPECGFEFPDPDGVAFLCPACEGGESGRAVKTYNRGESGGA